MNLYALCDVGLLKRFGLGFEEFVAIASLYDASMIQYRNKGASLPVVEEDLQELRRLWPRELIVNDFVEMAHLCDGVHLGQEDLEALCQEAGARDLGEGVELVRQRIGRERLLGLSTHNLEEIEVANRFDLDYIGLGAYRASRTKAVTNLLGSRLPQLAAASTHLVVAIGGVQLFDSIPNTWLKAVGSDLCIKGLTFA
ncbi:MAG: thiamine phosphate synthase [Nitratiruptor sp.]|nr:thiamine phosphate synthase [Nitratiruptor sp.]NPA83983.1 thiamine phosphate synthase [Campylobacterota bacterium]